MKALVIGGTGPTGPHIVNGLLERGYDVTVLHGGLHEVEFSRPVEHIHTDPHFAETLSEALGSRTFDLVVATYGRTRVTADVMKGRTARLITISGGGGIYASREDPRWGVMGPPLEWHEDAPLEDTATGRKVGYLMWLTEQQVLEAHRAGHYNATIFRYPNIYGPHAADQDWSIVRRILDGRKHFIIADGGLKIQSRAYAENAAHAVLLGVDQPEVAAGQAYNVGDETRYTMRQRIDLITKSLNHEWELVDMPRHLVKTCKSLWGEQMHKSLDITKIRTQLGYKDVTPAVEAIPLSARWLAEHRPGAGDELERQLGDPFDYAAEDLLIRTYQESMARVQSVYYPEMESINRYRHPSKPAQTASRSGVRQPNN